MWRPTSHPKGFSLIEVLVVLAIISIALTGITLSYVQAESRRIDEQASQLSAIFQAVSDRASLTNRRHRIQLDIHGFSVEEYYHGQWHGILSGPLQKRSWRDAISYVDSPMTLNVETTGLFSESVFKLRLGQREAQLVTNAFGEVQVAQ